MRRIEDLNGRGLAKFLRDEGRAPIKPQTVLLSVEASAGSGGRSGEARKIKEGSLGEPWFDLGERGRRDALGSTGEDFSPKRACF